MSIEAVLAYLRTHRKSRIALVSHQRPDGDAIGSCIGLADVLRAHGYDVFVINPSPVPANIRFIVHPDLVAHHQEPDWWRNFDCLGILDCGEMGRLDEVNLEAATNLPVFNIDHHISSDGVGDAVWVDPEASSTGEMVVRLCRAAGWQLTPRAAQGLWVALIADTGRFSFENTTPAALYAGAACLEAGVDVVTTGKNVFQASSTLRERHLQSRLLSRIETFADGRLALSWLEWRDFRDMGLGVEASQDLINLIRDVAGVQISIFMYESPPAQDGAPGSIKVSIRTLDPYNAIDLVGKYGGGGHKRAAGGTLAMPLEEARRLVIDDAQAVFFGE